VAIIGMIPARLQSSRLPEKALADICGLPMVVHTCKRAMLADSLDAVYLATDSPVIEDVAALHGIPVIMTGTHHQTGTDRIAEAVGTIEGDIIVNIQGDEPMVDPDHIDAIVNGIRRDDTVKVAIGVTPYAERNRSSDIKAVLDLANNILYCSRNDLPSESRTTVTSLWKMSFIVAFRRAFLFRYSGWAPTPLETIEYNEYLRILEHGYKIRAVRIEGAKISVDTPEDLAIIRRLMIEDPLRHQYTPPRGRDTA